MSEADDTQADYFGKIVQIGLYELNELKKYCSHKSNCSRNKNVYGNCDCGLIDVLLKIEAII